MNELFGDWIIDSVLQYWKSIEFESFLSRKIIEIFPSLKTYVILNAIWFSKNYATSKIFEVFDTDISDEIIDIVQDILNDKISIQ